MDQHFDRLGFLRRAGGAAIAIGGSGALLESAGAASRRVGYKTEAQKLVPYSGTIASTAFPGTLGGLPLLVALEKG